MVCACAPASSSCLAMPKSPAAGGTEQNPQRTADGSVDEAKMWNVMWL